jgi:hypothetical protein
MTHFHSRTVRFTLGVLVACGSCDQHVREGELAAAINFAEVVSVNGFEVVNAGLFEVFGTNRPTLTNPTPGQEHVNAPALTPLGARTAPSIHTEQGAATPRDDRRGSCDDWSTFQSDIAQSGITEGPVPTTSSRPYFWPDAGSTKPDQWAARNSVKSTWSAIDYVATLDNAESVTDQPGCRGTLCQPAAATLGGVSAVIPVSLTFVVAGSSYPMSARGACGTNYPVYSHLRQSSHDFWQDTQT